ncbi:MAG: glycine-rich domain-containing protein [Microthrixaceae bacterium]
MDDQRLRTKQGLRVEEVAGEVIVFNLDTGASIHHVTGDGVEALRLISDGLNYGDLPERLRASVDELIDAGVVEASTSVSRRKALSLGTKSLVAGGAVWGAATVTTFALADPAAAATPCTKNPPTTPAAQKYTANTTYITGRGVTSLIVKAWGGGGGGGGAGWSLDGGGGGGGAFAGNATLTVSPCTPYTITVGTGGTAGSTGGAISAGGNGGDGNPSSFASSVIAAGGKGGKGAQALNTGDGGPGGKATDSTGTTRYSGGNGKEGGGGGGGAGSSANGNDGTDPNGGTGGTGNPDGRGGRLSHSGDTTYSWHGYPAGGGGGAGDYVAFSGYYAPGDGAGGEVWIGY